jgi:hypothetical protein
MADEQLARSLTGKLQIEVFGADLEGRQFIEQTRTLTITRDGATISLANKLAPESELTVRNPVTNQEAVARVVDLVRDRWKRRGDGTRTLFGVYQIYGIAFVDPSVNLWQVEFPKVQFYETIIMECSRCHNVDAVLLSEIEMKICETKQSLTRHCECSNSSTTWKQTARRVTERRATENKVSDGR